MTPKPPDTRGQRRLYPGVPTVDDGRVGWRSITAGFFLNAAVFAVLVAVSHPVVVAPVVTAGIGLYALGRFVRRAGYERTVLFCRGRVCLRLQLSVG